MTNYILETGEKLLKHENITEFSPTSPEDWKTLLDDFAKPGDISANLLKLLDSIISELQNSSSDTLSIETASKLKQSMTLLEKRHQMEQLMVAGIEMAPLELRDDLSQWYEKVVNDFDIPVQENIWKLAPLRKRRWEHAVKYNSRALWWYTDALEVTETFIKDLPWSAHLLYRYNIMNELEKLISDEEEMDFFETTVLERVKTQLSPEIVGNKIAVAAANENSSEYASHLHPLYETAVHTNPDGSRNVELNVKYALLDPVDYHISVQLDDASEPQIRQDDDLIHRYHFSIPAGKEIIEIRFSFVINHKYDE